MNKKIFLPVEFLGTGYYLPETIISNEDYYEKKFGISAEWIENACGIKTRRRASPGQACSDLAIEAARNAMEKAKVTPEEIELVALATVSPDYVAPPTSNIIQNALGLHNSVAYDINVACVGFLWALAICSNFISLGAYKKALVICSELTSKGENVNDKDTFILLGDGAGAAIIDKDTTGERGILSYYFGVDSRGWKNAIIATRYDGVLRKEVDENTPKEQYIGGMSRNPSDLSLVKSNMHLFQMRGTRIYKFAVNALQDAVNKGLEKAGLKIEDVSLFIPHQANIRILESAREKLGIPKEKIFTNVDKYGNMGGATIPVALADAVEKNLIKRGDIIMLIGFAAGLNWGSILIKW
jgi:3-oxoacyl-[acyl-carrier-protein] synthase-3